MKNGKPESLAEALLLIEKMKGQLSEKNEKIEKQKEKLESKDQKIREQQNEIREKQVEIERLNEFLAHKRYREFAAKSEKTRKINAKKPFEVADENDRPVTKSAKEKRIIEKSPVTPSLLAHVFVAPFGAVVFPQRPLTHVSSQESQFLYF